MRAIGLIIKFIMLKKKFLYLIIFITLILLSNGQCFAALKFSDWQAGLQTTASRAGVSTASDLLDIIVPLINALLAFVGVFFFLLFIYGGFKWLTAAGAADKVDKAKKLLVNAVIGLAIIIAAYAITLFISKAIEGQDTMTTPTPPAASP